MALLTLNGVGCTDGEITLPKIGVWHADLAVAQNNLTMTGVGTIVLGSQTFTGFIVSSGVDFGGQFRARVLGGNGSFGTVLNPKGYNSVPFNVPLTDIVKDCNELGIDPTSDVGVLSTQLASWSRFQSSGGPIIRSLITSIPSWPNWRVLSNGKFWVGFDSWPVVTLPNSSLLGTDPERSRIRVASQDPTILPGQTFNFTPPKQGLISRRVSSVKHTLSASSIVTTLIYES